MIVLFTDFGPAGPYTGQMRAVLAREAPGVDVVELLSDAPRFEPMASAYLLAALAGAFPADATFLCVVDPGVGGARDPVIAEAGGRRFVGPGNGLFEPVLRRAAKARQWRITWRPGALSASFHGRDLFAPVAARLARGDAPDALGEEIPAGAGRHPDWPDDLPAIVYVDHFGNAITGLRAAALPEDAAIEAGGRRLGRLATFSDAAEGDAFWYENANGLAEIAVNQGRADTALGLAVGDSVRVLANA